MNRIIFTLLLFTGSFAYAQDCPDDCTYFIPNSLTADCDEKGCELLHIESDCDFTKFELVIFNRWGEVVFQTTNPEKLFDCTGHKEGSYMWKLSGKFCNGKSINDTGTILILK